MAKLLIQGGVPLCGTVRIHGAKNAVLPILAAAMLPHGQSVLTNCPQIADVTAACAILRGLGAQVRTRGGTILVDATSELDDCIPSAQMQTMRSSILFLGAMLARCGRAELSYPGGCALGERPINLHLQALRQMGAECSVTQERIVCRAARLHACTVTLPFPSVGATENVLLAATGADGTVTLCNAAREPEIVELAAFLRACGARVRGAGSSVIEVTGGELHGAQKRVCPDRMEAATYLAAAAATRGSLTLSGVQPAHLTAVTQAFRQAGCELIESEQEIRIRCDRLRAIPPVRTAPYPGFPTDAQPPMMAAMATAAGTTVFEENIFASRFRHAQSLREMGAKISCGRKVAVVTGVETLHAASVSGTDLRATAALAVAALAAQGESRIDGLAYLDRGYSAFAEKLRAVGARIRRVEDPNYE